MEREKLKQISKYITLLCVYFGSKIIFDKLFEFDEFDLLAFKGYASESREKFIEQLPKEKLLEIQNGIQKIIDGKFSKEILNFFTSFLYIYLLPNEKKEFEALNEYYDRHFTEIEDFQEKTTAELFLSVDLKKKLPESFDTKKFINGSVEDFDSNNVMGKVFRVGIKNKFFTKDELIEFYTEKMKRFF